MLDEAAVLHDGLNIFRGARRVLSIVGSSDDR